MPVSDSDKARYRVVSEDGTSTFPSRGVTILSTRPPSWDSHKISGTAAASGDTINDLNFNNFFIYNFYTLNERTRYHPDSNPWAFSPFRDGTGSLDGIRGLDGREIQAEGDESNRVTSGLVPSFIRLAWTIDNINIEDVASYDEIEQFKKIVGLKRSEDNEFTHLQNDLFRVPIRRNEGFEVMQNDWVSVSNEYLDMFSDLDLFRNSINNPWFAEEIDSVYFKQRLEFIYNKVIGKTKFYKNFLRWHYSYADRHFRQGDQPVDPIQNRHPYSQEDFALPGPTNPIGFPQVTDSAHLENINFPSIINVAPEITLVLNSEYGATISRASFGSSGKILGTQSRVRNIFHLSEYNQTDIDRENDPGLQPIEQLLMGSFPYNVSDWEGVDVNGSITKLKLSGFVVEKTEIRYEVIDSLQETTEPISRKYPLIFIPCYRSQDEESPSIAERYLDAAINYGSNYQYSVRAVFNFSLFVNTANGIKKFDYLVNSPYSSILNVEAKENTPPPYPRDCTAFFDYSKSNQFKPGQLVLDWAFPVNKQRDTAGFAIFRRNSIYEPFNMLKILDFNFSFENSEHSVRNLKIKLRDPVWDNPDDPLPPNYDIRNKVLRLSAGSSFNSYVDETFKLDTEYIYSICTIDAHGHISNYGAQLLVKYDSRATKLLVEQVSSPGAPLIFPNWFVRSKAFQDVARVSRYRRAVVKFRPDYKKIHLKEDKLKLLNLVKSTREEEGGHPSNCYYLQLINPDRGKDIVIRYQIDDTYSLPDNTANLKLLARMLGVSSEELRMRPIEEDQ